MAVPLNQLTVDDLVSRARTGPLNAFSELVRRYQGPLFNFLRQRTANTDDAEDLAQDAFLRAWQRLDRYDSRWRFSTWLFTIASRMAMNHHQKQSRRAAVQLSDDECLTVDEDPADRALVTERSSNLWSLAAEMLNETERSALWLRYAEDFSASDIARVLGKTTITVRVLLHRARRKLARGLAPRQSSPTGKAVGATLSLVCETAGANHDV